MRRHRRTSPKPPEPLSPALAMAASRNAVAPASALLVSTSPRMDSSGMSPRNATSGIGLTEMERAFVRALARVQIRALLCSRRSTEA